jgi:hypothetical protein
MSDHHTADVGTGPRLFVSSGHAPPIGTWYVTDKE